MATAFINGRSMIRPQLVSRISRKNVRRANFLGLAPYAKIRLVLLEGQGQAAHWQIGKDGISHKPWYQQDMVPD